MNAKNILFPALTLALSASATDLGVRYWRMSPAGDLAVGQGNEAGTMLDIEDDLGYGDAESGEGIAFVLGREHQLAIDWLQAEFSAGQELEDWVAFGGLVFPPGVEVGSSLDADLLRVAYRYMPGSDELRGGFLVGVQFFDLAAEASARQLGAAREETQAALPVVGAALEWSPHPYASFGLSLAGGSWTWDETEATFLDAEATARIHLRSFYAGLGYRHFVLDGEDESVPLEADLTIAGPTLYAGFLF